MKRMLEEAKRMIRLNSQAVNGNEELANYCQTLLEDRGMKVNLQQVTHSFEGYSKRQFNLIGVLGDPLVDRKIRKGLLLCTQMDTVSPGLKEHWTETDGDPFNAQVKEGKIFGLGAAETKLDFLAKLYAVAKFRERKLKMPVYLVGLCGGEAGMFGARYLVKAGTLNPKYVLVGSPTELKVVHAQKSQLLFKVVIGFQQVERDARGFNRRIDLYGFGRSAHACEPSLGVNAIEQSIEFLNRAIENGFELRYTRFDGGDNVNQVPDRSFVQFYLTSHQFEDFKRFFKETVKSDGKERAFKVELGGVGDAGVRFLPDALTTSLWEVTRFFQKMGEDFSRVNDPSFSPDFSTVNLGRLKQGVSQLELFFDCRLLPDLMAEQIESHVKQGIQKLAAQFPSLNLSVVRERYNHGLEIPQESDFLRYCLDSLDEAGIEPQLRKKSGSTEAAIFAQAGYDVAVFGPGAWEGVSHSPNESLELEQLERAVSFYEKIIERVCV